MEEEKEELNREIGARLRSVRTARGMTQAALGGRIGVSFQQVRKYEFGEIRVSTRALVEAARVLETSPLDLLGVAVQDRPPSDETLTNTDDDALLRTYREIASPKLRRIVRALARSLSADDDR